MSTSRTQFSARPGLFLVDWPLAQTSAGNPRPSTRLRKPSSGNKVRKTIRKNPTTNPARFQARRSTVDQHTRTEHKPKARELGTRNELGGRSEDGKYPNSGTASSVFLSLDHDEAGWLVEEVNEANKIILESEKNVEKLTDDDPQPDKKASIDTLKDLLKDLSWNISHPDEETAKGLDTWDEASATFGVRNMVNCLGLLDDYFAELKKQLDKQ